MTLPARPCRASTQPRDAAAAPTAGVPVKAHLVQRVGLTRAYVLGEAITALCGHRFVPTRDPAGRELCGGCEVVWRRLSDTGPEPAPRRRQ